MDHHHQLELCIPHFLCGQEPVSAPDGGVEAYPSTYDWSYYANPEESGTSDEDSVPFEYQVVPAPVQVPLPSFPRKDFFPLGLPIYSQSGFDLLTILARVATRKNPQVVLGPVDLTCSFVVTDTRRHDHPIVYCSPSFCALTGYSEAEIIGKNCRLLQAPGGVVKTGDTRSFTNPEAVKHLKQNLVAGKECQASLVNYKKDGSAFINLVTVIPIREDDKDGSIYYQVGFQVDLTEQPTAILERLRDGSYVVNYQQSQFDRHSLSLGRERKAAAPIPPVVMSSQLKSLLADQRFVRSIPITTNTNLPGPSTSSDAAAVATSAHAPNHPLHLMLLESAPDFIHVVSLKGLFLYVAPSVRRVLGYESEELVGLGWADLAHKEDVVPLMRELKDSSALTASTGPELGLPISPAPVPRLVDLLFRARTKMGRYVWIECRGRLHVEPGKGRKAIILTGRAREMHHLPWSDVRLAGGIAKFKGGVPQEFWGCLSGFSSETMAFMSATKGIYDILGYTLEEAVGLGVDKLIVPDQSYSLRVLGDVVARMRLWQDRRRGLAYALAEKVGLDSAKRVHRVCCSLYAKNRSIVNVWFVIYRADIDDDDETPPESSSTSPMWKKGAGIAPASLVYQIRLVDAETINIEGDGVMEGFPLESRPQNVFQELAISRGSSWQYELQQLRITNQKLEEELSSLQSRLTESSPEHQLPAQQEQPPAEQCFPVTPVAYTYPTCPSHRQEFYVPSQPDYLQPQEQPHPPRSQIPTDTLPFLEHPMAVHYYRAATPSNSLSEYTATGERPPLLSSAPVPQSTWGTMAAPPATSFPSSHQLYSAHPQRPPRQNSVTFGSSTKRSWTAMEASDGC